MKEKTLVILSGGMDSTVLLHHYLSEGHEVRSLSIDYRQRHGRELLYAHNTALAAGVPHVVADLSRLANLLPGSSLTDPAVEVSEGHYAEESMKKTVVPNRNMILLSVAIGHAIAHDIHRVAYGAHAGDHTIYPDCRREFVEAMNAAAALCDWAQVEIVTPFVHMSKADICLHGARLGVDFSDTYSCYKGEMLHCGVCGTCVERREAFLKAGVVDPTEYHKDAPALDTLLRRGAEGKTS